MELDRAHLDGGEQPADVIEVQIVFSRAVTLFDRNLLHMRSERAFVVLLEEAFAGSPAGAADQSHRPPCRVDHDQRLDRRIIVRQVLLRQAKLGEDHALGA